MKSSRVSLCWESRERSVGVGQDAGGLQWVRWRAELEGDPLPVDRRRSAEVEPEQLLFDWFGL